MISQMRTRCTNIKVELDYDEFCPEGFVHVAYIGNRLLSADIKFKTKPTQRQIRKLKKAWYSEMRAYDYISLYYKRYDIKSGKFVK